ncbi:MAG: HD-GYP domain-containing protein [Ilumatobacteraceae bacterium]
MTRSRPTSGQMTWASVAVGLLFISLLTSFGPAADRVIDRPEVLLVLAGGAALLAVFGATVVIALADRRKLAEIGLLGTALMAASLLPLVHGLVTPGVIYEDSAAFRASSFLTLPVAIALGAPLLVPNSSFGRWASRRWRDWTLLTLLVVFVLAAVLAVAPDAIEVPAPGNIVTIVVSLAMAVCFVVLSWRQLVYYEIGRRSSNLIASVSFLFIGATAFQPMVQTQYGLAFWWFHLAGGVGVFGVLVGLLVMKWRSASAQEILAPLLAREPLVAFELGLSPTVHQFIADLEKKDEITRDHVIRTGELALRVGERFGLSGAEMRRLGLAAMLHDVGKLKTPDEILKKPAGLDAAEYEVIKLHPVHGEEMLRAEPALAVAADIVRHHHERVDGGGYPDGLVGTAIPLASRIIACCDAWDAMTNDRPYRKAMPTSVATRIFREHAGTQWDPNVIDQVIATVMSTSSTGRLALVGRESADADDLELDAAAIERLLAAVDAEI